jgi:hypothetical protein
MREEWRWVVGFEGLYEISSRGRARSHHKGPRLMALSPHTGGYLMLHLYRDGARTPMTVHRAVLEAFVGPRPPGQHACHLDGDRRNNVLANLRYATPSENAADKVAHGTHTRGERSPCAKLTADQVGAIRALRGTPQQELAERFGVTFSNVSAIQLRKSWRHV